MIDEKRFSRALEVLFEIEGGYSDHPMDKGGKTKYGVTEVLWIRYCRMQNVEPCRIGDLTRGQAAAVYRDIFWRPCRCDYLLSPKIAYRVFDTAVHAGVRTGSQVLQRAYNAIQPNEVMPDLEVDGVIGPMTVGAVNDITPRYETALIEAQDFYTVEHYMRVAQPVFIRGWLNRIAKRRDMIG